MRTAIPVPRFMTSPRSDSLQVIATPGGVAHPRRDLRLVATAGARGNGSEGEQCFLALTRGVLLN